MRQFWADEENRILRNNYCRLTRDELMALLPERGWPEIQAKANRIGLRRTSQPRINKNFWMKSELEALREKYPIMTKSELQGAFPERTLASIYAQAQRMNLRRDVGGPVWTKREEIVLKNMLEEGATEIELQCEFRNKTWTQIVKKIGALKARKANVFSRKIYQLPVLAESFSNLYA